MNSRILSFERSHCSRARLHTCMPKENYGNEKAFSRMLYDDDLLKWWPDTFLLLLFLLGCPCKENLVRNKFTVKHIVWWNFVLSRLRQRESRGFEQGSSLSSFLILRSNKLRGWKRSLKVQVRRVYKWMKFMAQALN